MLKFARVLILGCTLLLSLLAQAQLACSGLFQSEVQFAEPLSPRAVILEHNEDIASIRGHIIRNETKRIRATYYQIDGNKVGRVFFAELMDAAKRGVQVQLITDAMNPPDWMDAVLTPSMYKALMAAGVEVRIFNMVDTSSIFTYLNGDNLKRSHDKLLIGDSQAMMTTGDHNMQNFEIAGARRGAKGFTYRGVEMAVRSEAMVAVANSYFDGMWKLSTPPDTSSATDIEVDRLNRFLPKFRDVIAAKDLYSKNWIDKMVDIDKVDFFSEVPGKKGLAPGIGAQLIDLIDKATDSLVIYAPYLRVTKTFEAALDKAIARGVKIRYVVPSWESIDTPWTMQVAQKQFEKLRKKGIVIRQHIGTDFLHAKMAIVDNKKVFVGTYNFNDRSEYTDYEIGFVVQGEDIIKQANEFDKQIMTNESKNFQPAKMVWYRALFISLLRLIFDNIEFLSNQR